MYCVKKVSFLHDFVHLIYSLGTLGKKKKQDFPPKIVINLAELDHFGSFSKILQKFFYKFCFFPGKKQKFCFFPRERTGCFFPRERTEFWRERTSCFFILFFPEGKNKLFFPGEKTKLLTQPLDLFWPFWAVFGLIGPSKCTKSCKKVLS